MPGGGGWARGPEVGARLPQAGLAGVVGGKRTRAARGLPLVFTMFFGPLPFCSCNLVCLWYNSHTMRARDRERLSQRRREAFRLLRACEGLLRELARPGPMMAGSFYEMYKQCGRPGCRCTRGELHGPFPVIAIARGGRRSTRSVRRDRVAEVRSRTEAYRAFQQKRRRLNQLMKRIAEIVTEIRDAHLEGFR